VLLLSEMSFHDLWCIDLNTKYWHKYKRRVVNNSDNWLLWECISYSIIYFIYIIYTIPTVFLLSEISFHDLWCIDLNTEYWHKYKRRVVNSYNWLLWECISYSIIYLFIHNFNIPIYLDRSSISALWYLWHFIVWICQSFFINARIIGDTHRWSAFILVETLLVLNSDIWIS
jgi:hypothetical protein